MKLFPPFSITPRLAPGLAIKDAHSTAWLSFESGKFVIDLPDGTEHVINDFHFPRGRVAGDTEMDVLQEGFASVLSFLGACAESRRYARGRGKDELDGENSDLFPADVGAWAESMSDEISMLQCDLEQRGLLVKGGGE